MEIRNVETFIKIADIGNFTKSAEALGYSQATVSAQIKQLESELEVPLFDRIGRTVQLTDAGRRFLPYATALLKASEDASSFNIDTKNPSGTLTIGASSSLSSGSLPKLLLKFHAIYPRIKLTVRTSDMIKSILNGLLENEIDFAFETDLPYIIGDLGYRSNFAIAAERTEQFVFVGHYSDPLTKRDDVALSEIVSAPFFITDRDASFCHFMEQELAKRDLALDPVMEFGSTAAIINILLQKAGISFLPFFMVEDAIKQKQLAVIHTNEFEITGKSQIFYNKNKWINPQMRVFIDFMREESMR